MDKIHDHSKFPRARELEIMEEKNASVGSFSFMRKKKWLSDPVPEIQGSKIKVQIQKSKNMAKEVQYEEILE